MCLLLFLTHRVFVRTLQHIGTRVAAWSKQAWKHVKCSHGFSAKRTRNLEIARISRCSKRTAIYIYMFMGNKLGALAEHIGPNPWTESRREFFFAWTCTSTPILFPARNLCYLSLSFNIYLNVCCHLYVQQLQGFCCIFKYFSTEFIGSNVCRAEQCLIFFSLPLFRGK